MTLLGALFVAAFITIGYAETTINSEVTFYGARDNCPPGADISHPIIHKEAGGLGTFDNPITFAGTTAAFKAGSIVYIPRLKKYFIMEDDCEECINDWKKKKYHIDCWIGPPTLTSGPELIACEDALTTDSEPIIMNANNGHPVDTTSLFNGTTQVCFVKADPCTDSGNECGNSCEIPSSASCANLAKEFYLTLKRFEDLNPNLDCSKNVPSGTSVCQGGTCGDKRKK